MTDDRRPIGRALISVHDKTGLTDLARALHEAAVAIVSTGATAARIAEAGVPVTPVEEVTGFPELLDGRVKTLHPHVHAGLLADSRQEAHRRQLDDLGIEVFDLVVGNLYPFAQTAQSGASAGECVEHIDIGGPAMVRAAAKNHANVAVVVSPSDYDDVIRAVRSGGFTLAERQRLAAAAFAHTAAYDVQVASWFAQELASEDTWWPGFTAQTFSRVATLRYGENPHQRAALYAEDGAPPGLAQAEQLHGKPMSYINYLDAEAAHRAAYDFDEPCVAIIKHATPCGVAIGADVAEAHSKALAGDPVSAFGGIVGVNRPVTVRMAEQVAGVVTHVVVAPDYAADALGVLTRKKDIRLLRCEPPSRHGVEARPISGGALAQIRDALDAPGDDPAAWTLPAGEPMDEAALADLRFAWRACRSVKSNAILLASGGATVGIGMGQVNRLDSARLAVARAGERAAGSVAASDAFFPFADGLRVLLDAGVRAVVQPGGSVRDDEVIAAAKEAGVPMYLTGTRHFFH